MIAAEGSAAVADVWARYTQPTLWPTWAPQIRAVDVDGDVLAPGMVGVVHGPLLIRVPFRIRDVDPVRLRWSWQVGYGPIGIRLDHGVDAVGAGSRAWVRMHVPALLALPYEPLAALALRRLVRG